MIYAGLDIGTTGSKITIFDDIEKKDRFYENYPSKRDANGHEIDASIIYETILHLIQNQYKLILLYARLVLLRLVKPL